MLSNLVKSVLKFSQIVAVTFVPLVVCSYLFPDTSLLQFLEPIKANTLGIVKLFTNETIFGGVDLTLVFIIMPWIIYIVIAGMIINMLDALKLKATNLKTVIAHKKAAEIRVKREQNIKNELARKDVIFIMLDLSFERFTISSLSEAENERKMEDVREKTLSFVSQHGGKVIQINDIQFENKFANAVIFYSQDSALNFMSKYISSIPIIDDEIQNVGYTVHYKAILDAQEPESNLYNVLEFLEKALCTASQNEIIATNSFADKYKTFGKMQHVKFASKGTYSINKQKVELNHIEI